MLLHSFEQHFLQSLHPSHRKSMRLVAPLLLLLALGQLIAWLMPVPEELRGISGYLPLHTLFETVAIVIAMLVFAISQNKHDHNQSGNLVLLGCAFFTVGWLDFSHTLSYQGMPDFVTPSDPEKGLDFWLAARFIASVALLTATIRPWRPFASPRTRKLLLGSGIVVILAINWVVLYYQEALPHTFITGQGLTQFKINLEFFFIALNLATALLLWNKMRQPLPFNAALLFGAVVVMAMSEFFFTLYATMTDIFNVLGHIYKVIAYLLIYRAIVVEGIEEPYRKLHQAQQNLALAIHSSNIGLWDWVIANNTVHYSPEWKEQLGYLPDELPDEFSTWESRIHPEDCPAALQKLHDFLASSEDNYENEFRLRHRDGQYRWIMARGKKQHDSAGKVTRLIGSHIDISQRKQDTDLFRYAVEAAPNGMIMVNERGIMVLVNSQCCSTFGYTKEEVLGQPIHMLLLEAYRKNHVAQVENFIAHDTAGRRMGHGASLFGLHKDGHQIPVEVGLNPLQTISGRFVIASIIDITEHKKAEEEIHNLAFMDPLTGLPNRRLLLDRLGLALSVSARSQHYGAVLFIDMDKFKTLNDTLGHDIGDLLLIEVASRIKACLREIDTVARLGGDEFLVLLEDVDEHEETALQKIALIAEKIRAALSEPYRLRGHNQHSSPSIGVNLYLGNEKSVELLLKCADIAMYQAKDAGRNAVRFFDPAMQQAVETHAALEADLRDAVSKQQLHLYYQIQMDNDRHMIGAEVLIRWIHPSRGMVSPMQFIPIAEESGLIIDIGDWVLDTACRQLGLWAKEEITRNLIIAVNVSAQQFKQPDFVDKICAVLDKHQINPALLKLELTESVVLDDVKGVVAKMHDLKKLGVRLSMDDFGTGYSSLSYLKQLPLDQLKIDMSFVRDMLTNANDAVMVKTIIDMAHNFQLNVIAEGVETEAQMNSLMQMGCMAYQGYYFSKPVPIEQLGALIQERRQ